MSAPSTVPAAILAPPLRAAWRLALESGLTSSIGLASLCAVYGLAYEVRPTGWSMLSATCLFWTLFLADRLAEHSPDADHAAAFLHERRGITRVLLALALGGGALSCLIHPPLALPILGALVCGFAYFTPLPLLGRAVKDLPGAKSFYAATLILAICHLYVWPLQPATAAELVALVAVLALEQMSNALYDLKDLESDRQRGIQTLALLLGHRRLLAVEACVGLVGLGLVICVWSSASWALACSFLLHLGAMAMLLRRPFDRAMTLGLDLAYSLILLLAVLGSWLGG